MIKLLNSFIFLLLTGSQLLAQGPQSGKGVFGQPVMPGPDKVLVFAYDTTATTRAPDKQVQYIVYRNEAQRGFKKIATLSWPSSPAELEKRLGSSLTQAIIRDRKLASVSDLLKLLEAGKTDTLGNYISNLTVWEAVGMLYIDREKNVSDMDLSYKVEEEKNGVVKILYQSALRDTRFSNLARFRQYSRIMNDSLLMVTWYALGGKASEAQLFMSHAGTKIPPQDPIILYNKKDTLFASWAGNAVTGQRMDIFIRAVDMAGNTGPASDTVQLIALSTTKVPSIKGFKATDTTGSILLQWEALPAKAFYTGIQLFKSRSATDGYIVVDTLPVTATTYLDRNILPGVQYYYTVEPVLFNLPSSGKVVPAQATAAVTYSAVASAAPLAPQGLRLAIDTNRNIVLRWQANCELDLFAYFVLRGTSPGNMQVISSPVRDTVFVDSIQHLAGGIAYLYGVRAISMGQLLSDTSELLSIFPPKARMVTAPGGLSATASPIGVSLRWDNVAITDPNVAGYALYRRKKGETHFQLLNEVLIPGNYYVDSSRVSGELEYGVTAADARGNQSILSPTAEVNTDNILPLYPPATFYLRNLSTGIEISMPLAAGDQKAAGGNYIIYRRAATQGSSWKKVGETSVNTALYIDRAVQRDQLYVYALSLTQQKRESVRSEERAIRRK